MLASSMPGVYGLELKIRVPFRRALDGKDEGQGIEQGSRFPLVYPGDPGVPRVSGSIDN
jgi:hypothetical protein